MGEPKDMFSAESAHETSTVGNTEDPVCRITAKQWDVVALWTWDVKVEMCPICKSSIVDVCIECRSMGGGSEDAGVGTKNRSCNSQGVTLKRDRVWDSSSNEFNNTDKKWIGEAVGECVIVWGVCSHVFHHHCISRWLQQRPACPVCSEDWKVVKTAKNEG